MPLPIRTWPRPPQEQPDDWENVGEAAWVLRVSEWDLFRLAWRRWHGTDEGERELEQAFHSYLAGTAVPTWVRHFCRQVLDAKRAGSLDPADFGAHTMRRREPVMQFSARFIGISAVVMLLLYLFILYL